MNGQKTIGVDIDGVLADFNSTYVERVIAITGRDLFPPRPFAIPCWDYAPIYGYTKEEEKLAWVSIIEDPTFWAKLSPYADTEDSIKFLVRLIAEGHDVYFVTARPGLNSKKQTEDWLRRMGMPSPTVLISHSKGLCADALKLDAYIDDRWENAVDVVTRGVKTFLLDRPWNSVQDAAQRGIVRVTSVVSAFGSVFPEAMK
jgi:5'(3')-deoxyribonucleotidase